ncbi:MAG: hypothetical protein JJU02_09090 [Cryomorphaceae bacterium]|nr:hypothetical protein [Cryomorphaceae bacterium]
MKALIRSLEINSQTLSLSASALNEKGLDGGNMRENFSLWSTNFFKHPKSSQS